MALSRAKKEEILARYVDMLSQSDGIIIADFGPMSVAETEQLRHKLREANSSFMVTKNTLFKLALEQAEWPVPESMLTGRTGVAFAGTGNLPDMAKAVLEFSKDFEAKFGLKGGVMGANIFEAGDVKTVSEMPTLPEIQAQILGLLVAPSQNMVNVFQAATSGVVNVLQPATTGVVNVLAAHEHKLKTEGEGTDAAA